MFRIISEWFHGRYKISIPDEKIDLEKVISILNELENISPAPPIYLTNLEFRVGNVVKNIFSSIIF